MAHALIEAAGSFKRLLADRGYDADHLRKRLAEGQAEAVIPTTTARKKPLPYDVAAYRQRNTVGPGSRTSDASQPATTSSPLTSSPASSSQPPSPTEPNEPGP